MLLLLLLFFSRYAVYIYIYISTGFGVESTAFSTRFRDDYAHPVTPPRRRSFLLFFLLFFLSVSLPLSLSLISRRSTSVQGTGTTRTLYFCTQQGENYARGEEERRVALGISGVLMHNSIRVRLETSIQLADYFFSRAAALSRLVLFFLFLSAAIYLLPAVAAGPERRGAKARGEKRFLLLAPIRHPSRRATPPVPNPPPSPPLFFYILIN